MMQQPPELPPTITFVPWANAFTPEEMDRIEGVGDVLPLAQAGLMTDIAANTRDRIRITRTAWLDSIAVNKWIYDRIQQITTMINAMSYRFELTGFSERIQYSVYHGTEGGITIGMWIRARWSPGASSRSPSSSPTRCTIRAATFSSWPAAALRPAHATAAC